MGNTGDRGALGAWACVVACCLAACSDGSDTPSPTDATTDGTTVSDGAHDAIAPEADAISPEADAISPETDAISPETDAISPEADAISDEADAIADEADAIADETDAIADETDAVADETDAASEAGDETGDADATVDAPDVPDVPDVPDLGPEVSYPACTALDGGGGGLVVPDLLAAAISASSLVDEAFTAAGSTSASQWSYGSTGLSFQPTAAGSIGTARYPNVSGIDTYVASVQISFVGTSGDTDRVGGGLLINAADPSSSHGDIDRIEVRLDRNAGNCVVVLEGRLGGASDPSPNATGCGTLAGASTYTLVFTSTPGHAGRVQIPEAGVDLQVLYPVLAPAAGGFFGLVARGDTGDEVTLSNWTVCGY